MLKAVNMKNYRLGKTGAIKMTGFGVLDTDTGTLVSIDGVRPYVLGTKKLVQSTIDAHWYDANVSRVNYYKEV